MIGDVATNLARMKEVIGRADAAGASLAVFPELFLTGYELSPSDVHALAEEKDGASFKVLSAAAREAGVAVLYGYPERDVSSDPPRYFNSAQLLDADGTSLANYRKLHLWTKAGLEVAFTPGEAFADIVECCRLKIGILICYDVEFPECSRILAHVILVPTAATLEYGLSAVSSKVIPALAFANELYIGYVNYGGEGRFGGRSVLCGPSPGTELAQAREDSETLLLAQVKLDFRAQCQCSYLKNRRPELYSDLCTT